MRSPHPLQKRKPAAHASWSAAATLMLTVRWPACHVAVAGGVWAGQWASSPRIGPVNRRVESERCVETPAGLVQRAGSQPFWT